MTTGQTSVWITSVYQPSCCEQLLHPFLFAYDSSEPLRKENGVKSDLGSS